MIGKAGRLQVHPLGSCRRNGLGDKSPGMMAPELAPCRQPCAPALDRQIQLQHKPCPGEQCEGSASWEQAVNKAQICAQGDRKEPGAEKAGAGRDVVLPWLPPLEAGSALFPPYFNWRPIASFWLHHHHHHRVAGETATQHRDERWLVPAPAAKSWNEHKGSHHGVDLGA